MNSFAFFVDAGKSCGPSGPKISENKKKKALQPLPVRRYNFLDVFFGQDLLLLLTCFLV